MNEQPTPQPGGVSVTHPAHGTVKIINADEGICESFAPDGRLRKKVAIVGFAASTRDLAPYDDPEWEVWGVNQLYRLIPRATRWFEIHRNWNEFVVEGTDHLGWLAKAEIPIYMAERIAQIPNSVKYPLERLCTHDPKYFTSTIAYMVRLALEERFTDIGLYGIDLIVGTEWFYQKANTEFWLGVAHGMGVNVHIPPQSALCKASWLYGYELQPPMWPIKLSEMEERVAYLKNERHKKIVELANIDGSLQEAQMWHSIMDVTVKSGQRDHLELDKGTQT
jgi:hypothetical protein